MPAVTEAKPFHDDTPVSMRAREIAAEVLSGTNATISNDWKIEKNEDNKTVNDQRQVLVLPLDKPLSDEVTNAELMKAIGQIVSKTAIGFQPDDVRHTKVVPPYALRETPEGTPPEFRIDLSSNFASHLRGKLAATELC